MNGDYSDECNNCEWQSEALKRPHPIGE